MSSHDAKSRQGAELGLGRELFGLFAIFCGLLFVLSLATFDSRDPWINHVVSGVTRVHNKAGLFGSYLAGFFYDLFGIGSWTAPACLCLAGARRILGRGTWVWWRWTGFFLLGLCMCLAGAASDLGDVEIFAKGAVQHGAGNVSTHGGGIAGQMLYVGMVGWMSSTGTGIVWLFCLLLALQMLTGISWIALLAAAGQALWRMVSEKARAASAKRAEGRDFRLVRSQERAERILTVSAQRPPPGALRLPGPASPADPAGNAARPSALSPGCEQKIGEDDSDMVSPLPRAVPFSAPIGSGIGDSSGIAPVFFEAGENFSRHPAENPASPEQEERPEPSPQARGRNEGSGPLPFRESTSPASASRRAREEKKEEDLPPWLHDFEEERLGAPLPSLFPTTPSEPSLPEDAAGARRNAGQKDLPPTEQNREEIPLMRGSVIADAPHGADGTPDPDAEPAGPDEGKAADAVGRSASDREATAPGAAFPEARVPVPPVLSSSDKDRDADEGVPEKDPAIASAEPMSDRAASLRVEPGAPAQEPPDRSSEKEPDRIPILAIPPVEAAPQAPDSGLLHSVLLLTKKRELPLPSLELLRAAPAAAGATPRAALEEKGRSLMTCLNDFGILGELVGIIPGPVVTMFEVRPAPGVRVSRIANLTDDLALALKAVAVRIQAPVPGTDTVGIEIPNAVRETVSLKELLGSRIFSQSPSLLTLALGKDIAGIPAVADLGAMPHLLVAGATGAGKSVGINSIILSLLFKARPDEVKLLLIDPKRVEMAVYADLPHLVHPVVTEMPLAKNALEWAVQEMERRYSAMARAGVRSIADYNAKISSWGQRPPEGMEDLECIPFLVLIVDELADLMLVAAKEVETSIVRLAQLARAAGIHLILATQRPSVDVVTGLIKANFPCRISFQVTSKHDSRTILDTVGAEHLLGKGDMLFKPGGGKSKRLHGAFVSDQDVTAVVDYWKSQQRPEYQIDFSDWSSEADGAPFGGGNENGDIVSDPLYNEAVEFVRQQGKASISLIQRKFRIGFNKAARFVEQMEQDGIISPADGSRPRQVIR